MSEPDALDRRHFARRTLGALGAFFAALFGVPGIAALADPALKSVGSAWAKVASAAGLKEGVAHRFSYEVRAGWERRKETGFLLRKGETIVAFSSRCTHLGCKVRAKDGAFRCPCHGGVFDLDGQPVEGPVQTPLERFETRVAGDGSVEVKV